VTNLYADAVAPDIREVLAIPPRALTIGAHPDDAEFGAGGTLAKWAQDGSQISMVIVTDGSKGSWDPAVAPADLARVRAAEQAAAAAKLGVTGEVIHLDYVDGELEYSMDLRRQICGWIRRLRPDVVLSHDPWRRYMLHPDHRATGMGTIDGVVAARDHLFFPELELEKHRPDAILLWSPDEPDYWEDIAPTFGTKIAALLCHSSQTRTTMNDAAKGEEARAAFITRMKELAARNGVPVGIAQAEAFKLLRP
jgi:LmbE family N-acetylglucosaminyl deacetylase